MKKRNTVPIREILVPSVFISLFLCLFITPCSAASIPRESQDPTTCPGAALQQTSATITGPGTLVDVNVTYQDRHQIGTNATFEVNITAHQLNGYLVPVYLQVFMDTEIQNYTFLSFLGGSSSVGSPYSLEIETRSSTEVDNPANATARIWFKLGYKFNDTNFDQIASQKRTANTVELVTEGQIADPNEGKIWFLFFPLEPYQFALLIVAIVLLSLCFVRRSKKTKNKSSKADTEKAGKAKRTTSN